jgi:hypothetical protein
MFGVLDQRKHNNSSRTLFSLITLAIEWTTKEVKSLIKMEWGRQMQTLELERKLNRTSQWITTNLHKQLLEVKLHIKLDIVIQEKDTITITITTNNHLNSNQRLSTQTLKKRKQRFLRS